MKKYLFIFIFVSIAQLFYGQEKYTIQGELPDHSLDNSYLRLTNSSALSQEKERIKHLFIDSILVVDGKFHYEGVLSQKPFLAYLYSAGTKRKMLDFGLYFIVESGNIHIRIANWADEGVVSGTPINEDYNTYIITRRSMEINYSFREICPIPGCRTVPLIFLLNGRRMSRDPNFPKYLQILDRMPKADRDILLAWLDYTIKKYEYEKKPNHYWTVYVTMPLVSSRLFRVIHHQQR